MFRGICHKLQTQGRNKLVTPEGPWLHTCLQKMQNLNFHGILLVTVALEEERIIISEILKMGENIIRFMFENVLEEKIVWRHKLQYLYLNV